MHTIWLFYRWRHIKIMIVMRFSKAPLVLFIHSNIQIEDVCFILNIFNIQHLIWSLEFCNILLRSLASGNITFVQVLLSLLITPLILIHLNNSPPPSPTHLIHKSPVGIQSVYGRHTWTYNPSIVPSHMTEDLQSVWIHVRSRIDGVHTTLFVTSIMVGITVHRSI